MRNDHRTQLTSAGPEFNSADWMDILNHEEHIEGEARYGYTAAMSKMRIPSIVAACLVVPFFSDACSAVSSGTTTLDTTALWPV